MKLFFSKVEALTLTVILVFLLKLTFAFFYDLSVNMRISQKLKYISSLSQPISYLNMS